jgi:hypothetical protein
MTQAMRAGWLMAVSAAVACACGAKASTSSSSPNTSGLNLDSAKRLADLSATDWQSLCDWVAQEEGGYGNTIACDAGNGGSLIAPTDESGCVAEYSEGPNCPATVQDMVLCIQNLTQTWCVTSMLPAECRMLKKPC